MSQRYNVTSSGQSVIPISDGDFYTEPMLASFNQCEVEIEFYSDAGGANRAEASGQVVVMGSRKGSDESAFFEHTDGGRFDASMAQDPFFQLPNALGTMTVGKLSLSGITGATHFKATFVRW